MIGQKKKGRRPAFHQQKFSRSLNIQNVDQLLDGCGALMQSCAFFVGQIDLDDLFNTAFTKFDRNADEEIADAVFTF
jgi:hypothetical protein